MSRPRGGRHRPRTPRARAPAPPRGCWHTRRSPHAIFPRGRTSGRHRAALNFGDCLAYAAAATADDSLLFVGGDFALIDVTPA